MIGKITIAMNLCVNWYYITDFDLELLEIVLDFHCLFLLQNSIMQFIIDRPVEKMHLKELKEILLRKKVSLKYWQWRAQLVAKWATLCFIRLNTLENFNAPLIFVSLFFLSKWLQV